MATCRTCRWVGRCGELPDSRGFPIPSPSLLEKNGDRFRRAVERYAEGNRIPWVRFVKVDRKLEVMRPLLDRLAPAGTHRGRGDRGGAGVPAGLHRHHALPRGWWRSAL